MKTITLFTLIILSSCANHLKEFSQQAQTVSLDVAVVGSATIDLSVPTSLLGSVVNATVKSSDQHERVESRIQSVLTSDVVKSMVISDATERLGTNIPFAVADGKTDGSMEIVVNQYGISPTSGTFAFTMDLTISVFSGFTGEQVYSKSFWCSDDSFVNFSSSPGNVFNTATTMGFLDKMTDEQMQQSLKAVVEKCTQIGLSAMRSRATN